MWGGRPPPLLAYSSTDMMSLFICAGHCPASGPTHWSSYGTLARSTPSSSFGISFHTVDVLGFTLAVTQQLIELN